MAGSSSASAEWLTEMMLKRVESASEEYRKREWEFLGFSHDEIMLHEAKIVLSYYKLACLALDIDSGKARDPLRLEEMFTEEEIANGFEFGTKHRRGWPERVTGYETRHLALNALKEWVDWEQSPGPDWARRAPRNVGEREGMTYANGEEWLEWNSKVLGGWKSCRDVYLLKMEFDEYLGFLKWEKAAKAGWEKRRKKVLGAPAGKKSAIVVKKSGELGKNGQRVRVSNT